MAALERTFSLWEFYQINFSDWFSLNAKTKDEVLHTISCWYVSIHTDIYIYDIYRVYIGYIYIYRLYIVSSIELKKFFSWSIVDLQCCVNYCCTAKWFSYTYIYILFLILFSIMVYDRIFTNIYTYIVRTREQEQEREREIKELAHTVVEAWQI